MNIHKLIYLNGLVKGNERPKKTKDNGVGPHEDMYNKGIKSETQMVKVIYESYLKGEL